MRQLMRHEMKGQYEAINELRNDDWNRAGISIQNRL